MNRRDALKKLGMGGATVIGASAVLSSPAFADGGSATCRPTPSIPNLLVPAVVAGKKRARAINSQVTTFSAATCGCGSWTSTVQRRWSATGPESVGIYSAATGGTLLSGSFSAEAGSVTITNPVYLRATAGTNLSGSYLVTLTLRHVCREGSQIAWSCQRYQVQFSADTSGPSGTVTGAAPDTIGPPDNTDACDSPPPT